MAVKLQKHQRQAIEAARAAASTFRCTVELADGAQQCHLKVRVVNPKTGRFRMIGISSSPKNRDHAVKATAKAARAAALELTR